MKVLLLPLASLLSLLPWTAHGQNDTFCQYYTKLLFVNDTADNEYALIQAVVNLAVLGNETLNVSGILAPDAGLLELFNGSGPTTNRNGEAVVLNFLDGAGGLPGNLNETSNTYFLLTHLYQFFGALLGCSAAGYPPYEGVTDMYYVHKFMNINKTQNDYFIAQVGAAAAAYGVSSEDITAVANVLDTLFNYRCTPPLTADSGVPSFMVGTDPSICQASDCPVANVSYCEADNGTVTEPPTNGTNNQTFCQKYTAALFLNDTADNEYALIQAVVNLAVLGNESRNVSGILYPNAGLLELFNGSGPTTNRNGEAVVLNFLDGAGGLPGNLNETSNTYFLLTHLYQFFGALLGCSAAGYPPYEGVTDMYYVHKFMNINKTQNDYFIAQVGAAAAAYGVSPEDITAVANVLDTLFNYRCTPPLTADSGVPAFMNGTDPSICQASDCPVANVSYCEADNGTVTEAPTQAPTNGTSNQTFCMKYTAVLFGNDTADNEYALIEAVVNLAVLGNETLNVSGILYPDAGLLELFNGSGPTTNRGDKGVVINFLDGAGGGLPGTSNTYSLLTHLYQFFGALLGCSAAGYPPYEGVPDMYEVHKFMNINKNQNDYFIAQVGAAAAAYGVSPEDITAVAKVLDTLFNYRCTPPLTADSGVPEFMVGTNSSICQASDCPVKNESYCGGAPTPTSPSSPTSPASPTKPTSPTPTSPTRPSPAAPTASGGVHAAHLSTAMMLVFVMILFV